MTPHFVFPFKDIENGMLDVHEPLLGEWLTEALADTDVVPTPDAVGRLDVCLTTSGRDVVVHGSVQATVSMACARCLDKTPVKVKAELSLLLVPGKPPKPEADETEKKRKDKKNRKHPKGEDDGHLFLPEEAELDTYVGDEVVLDDFVREAILLELPIFPLCSETCPGIGAVPSETAESASAEDVIDPRLAPLLEFKKKSRV